MSIFAKAADAIRNIGYVQGMLRANRGHMCALGAIGYAYGLNHALKDKSRLCSLVPGADRHPPEVHELVSLLTEAGWPENQSQYDKDDPCPTVFWWSDHTDGEHVGDVLFALGEGSSDKAKHLLEERWEARQQEI